MCSVEVYIHAQQHVSFRGFSNWIFNSEIRGNNERAKNNTGPYGTHTHTPRKSVSVIFHLSSWPKKALEPKFHEAWNFGGFGKMKQAHKQARFKEYRYRYR